RLAVPSAKHTITVYDVGKDGPALVSRLKGHTRTVVALAFSADGRTLASASRDGTVRRWSLPDGKPLGTHPAGAGPLEALALAPDGRVAVRAAGGAVILLGPRRAGLGGRVWNKARRPRPVRALAFAPDGKRLLSGGADGAARLWDVAGQELRVLTHGGPVTAVAFSPAGDRAVTGGEDRSVVVWDA